MITMTKPDHDTTERVAQMQMAIVELTTVVTFAEALEIVRRWGNRRFRVPMKVGIEDPLALTLGLECAQRLVKAYGGQCLELPAERHALRQMRNEAIWQACAVNGRSPAEVALEFGLTRQSVSWLMERMRASRQEAETC
jgi:hypothetical protein